VATATDRRPGSDPAASPAPRGEAFFAPPPARTRRQAAAL